MKAKKSFGQHFLIDESVSHRIADHILKEIGELSILEVGPGTGALTYHLLESAREVFAIEADVDAVRALHTYFPHHPALKVVHANFLKYDLTELMGSAPFAIVGNFPYNISSQIIFRLLDHREQCPLLIGMFQKELADRIISPPGSKVYGAISALTQFYYAGERLMTVEPNAFKPPPKVRSAVITLRRRDDLPDVDYQDFRRVVKLAFSQRRKKLRNTIGHMVDLVLMEDPDILDLRPERLSVDDFATITSCLRQS